MEMVTPLFNTGVRPPADKRKRLFEAFFTTKRVWVWVSAWPCRSIIEAHGGVGLRPIVHAEA
jgi:hypothetical protein